VSKRRKNTKRKANTEKASNRIFYRRPSVMFAEFIFSGAGLTFAPLAIGAATLFMWHVAFIKIFGG
jgi:phage antirepressor YoqD-like protein